MSRATTELPKKDSGATQADGSYASPESCPWASLSIAVPTVLATMSSSGTMSGRKPRKAPGLLVLAVAGVASERSDSSAVDEDVESSPEPEPPERPGVLPTSFCEAMEPV